VELIDVSAGGALVESVRRLLPGTAIELSLSAGERCTLIRGRVLRCSVVGVRATAMSYHGAIGFDRDLAWFSDHDPSGYFVPTEEMPSRQTEERERATPIAI
jgi:hypothetical protein